MNRKEIEYLVIIMVIFVAACIETDIYLPAFPDMMAYFAVSEEAIQKLLTWNFIGFCISGPVYGPISDSFGRRKPLLAALGLFLAGSIVTVVSAGFDGMLWGRVLQGLGAGGIFTLGTAIIFDAFSGKNAVAALNQINSINPFIFAGAPILGGYLNQTYGFRSNFLTIALLVLLSFLICILFFGETLLPEKRSRFHFQKILGDFRQVVTSLPFWQLTAVISLLFAGYIAFLAGISVLYVIELGVSKQTFPIFQATILGANLLASLTCGRAISLWGISNVKKTGTALVSMGGLATAVVAILAPTNPYLLTLTMMPYSFGYMWTQTPYCGELMELLPKIKGITASVLTSARLLISAFVVGLTSHLYNASIVPLALVIVGISLIVLITVLFYEKKVKATEGSVTQI